MTSHQPQENNRHKFASNHRLGIWVSLLLSCGIFLFPVPSLARSAATPWTSEVSFQSLVYGASSSYDVARVMGAQPDEIVRSTQMFPPVENFYYYDKTGAATVFIFENGLLVGMQLKTPENQYVDMSYFLADNGDRRLNNPMLGGYFPYYPIMPLTWFNQ